MEIREAKTEEAEKISKELWLPLAREMEEVSGYNQLKEDIDVQEVIEHKRDKIDGEEGFFFVAEENGELLGFISGKVKESAPVFSRGEKLKVNELFVKEKFRRKGVASMLLEDVEKKARRRDCSTLELDVNKANKSAQKLYRDRDFETERKRMVKTL